MGERPNGYEMLDWHSHAPTIERGPTDRGLSLLRDGWR